jgi:hypothetical protein
MATPAPAPAAPCRDFDQVLSGDVKIERKKHSHDYKIKFRKISDILLYQIWNDTYPELNADRRVLYIKAKKWVKKNFINPSTPNPPVPYEPTCVFELDDDTNYVCVINDAKIKNDHVVFYVSTENIVIPPNSKKRVKLLTKLRCGEFKNVRFDIDNDPECDEFK